MWDPIDADSTYIGQMNILEHIGPEELHELQKFICRKEAQDSQKQWLFCRLKAFIRSLMDFFFTTTG